ncbi:MAG TPA: PRC and DUF2382 domain-containing protein [Jatrophihabitans sp.]|jgi:uncharacterized protein (TIGR02271 family)|uniref:DUF2382 domain-containing protein n=1 Tax=Jatrophihabitans sp. TaxID=1932789 RepID=UPI002EFB1D1A
MMTPEQLQSMIGQTAVDSSGDKIGRIGQIYLDDSTGDPQWVTVSTGMFGTKESFAPLYGSRAEGQNLMLAVSKAMVKDAPNVENDGHLDESEVQALYQYYNGYLGEQGMMGGGGQDYIEQDMSGRQDLGDQAGVVGHDTSGPTTDDAMTRSEERVRVGTQNVETGRARLRKYIVTENVTQTVPVSREEVRIEREPITEENMGKAMSGGDLTEEEHEVTLHAERPVVEKETVPVERVRLATETVTSEETVSEQVRKEQIEEPQTEIRGDQR